MDINVYMYVNEIYITCVTRKSINKRKNRKLYQNRTSKSMHVHVYACESKFETPINVLLLGLINKRKINKKTNNYITTRNQNLCILTSTHVKFLQNICYSA